MPCQYSEHNAVRECGRRHNGDGWCRFSPDIKGWGCRFLIVVPDRLPRTKKERGLLFSKVYDQAEKSGVLQCPYFIESTIDEVVEDKGAITAMMKVCSPTVTL